MGDALPGWGVIFLSEVDSFRDSRHLPNSVHPSSKDDFPSTLPNSVHPSSSDQFPTPLPNSVHSFSRHWPGEGSFALRAIMKPCLVGLLHAEPIFKGRCGLFSFKPNDTFKRGKALNVLLVHGPHDDHFDLCCRSE